MTSYSSNWFTLLLLCISTMYSFVLRSIGLWFKTGKAWTSRPGNGGLWCITVTANCTMYTHPDFYDWTHGDTACWSNWTMHWGYRVRNLQPIARIHLDSPGGILQESMDSHLITLYDKLKHLQESKIDSCNFVEANLCENGFSDSCPISDPGILYSYSHRAVSYLEYYRVLLKLLYSYPALQ